MSRLRIAGILLGLAGFIVGSVPAFGQTQLNAAGATFPYPIYSKWFSEYHKKHPDIQINYQSIGSGGGIQQLLSRTVDFGASDGPMTDEQLKKSKIPILHFPTVLGAAVPSYNIPGVNAELNFSGETLANIYLGKITKWNDAAITRDNPGVKLPGTDIVVVHRSDGSGTTYIWTDFLSKVSPEWKSRVGHSTSVNWPVGLGGKGNEGVMGVVKQTPGAMGYVELIYAIQNHVPYGRVKNSTGIFVKADLKSVSEAAAGAATNMPADFRVSITNAPGKGAYPISSFTWLLIPEHFDNPQKGRIVVDFLKWMMVEGQQYTTSLAYAPLPKPVVAKEMKAVSKITF
ncbi:MAG: phosphate ABC transporter substrate-binding protein PstS [Acidobacteriia bacterium]|nr:phosphate ABC transporter substrate-binding protein PstS [Terriglobia bacterium]